MYAQGGLPPIGGGRNRMQEVMQRKVDVDSGSDISTQ